MFWYSCNKNDVSNTVSQGIDKPQTLQIGGKNLEGVSILDGALHFKDVESYRQVRDDMNNASLEDYLKFCKENHFISIALIHEEINNKISKAINNNSQSEYDQVFNEYSDIVQKSDDSYDYKFNYGVLLRIVNRQSVYTIETTGMLFEDQHQYIYRSENQNNLSEFCRNPRSFIGDKQTKSFNMMKNNGAFRVACAVDLNTGWVLSPSNNKRRGILYRTGFVTFTGTFGQFAEVWVEFHGRSQTKSIFGWNNYNTDHTVTVRSGTTGRFIDDLCQTTQTTYSGTSLVPNTTDSYVDFLISYFTITNFNCTHSTPQPDLSLDSNFKTGGGVDTDLICP